MHYYSIDNEIRRKVIIFISLLSFLLPTFIENLKSIFGLPPDISLPISFGVIFGFFYFVFDIFIWKYITFITNIPNLNGHWECEGKSSYLENGINFNYKMTLTIKQTFSKIEIIAQTDSSNSKSIMASIFTDHAIPIFRYTYENTPLNLSNQELQRHTGFIELWIKDKDLMEGNYFSGKHRLSFGELTCKRTRR